MSAQSTHAQFVAFPDTSRAGKVRFLDALVAHDGRVVRTSATPCLHCLVEVRCTREDFAIACGTPGRPIPTESARVASSSVCGRMSSPAAVG